MGEGKTEAALHLAGRWSAGDRQRGLYFALPTQATSNQILHRLRIALQQRYPGADVDLQLLHGSRLLSAEFTELMAAAEGLDDDAPVPGCLEGPRDEASDAGAVVATRWFTARKRGLLSAFGVGTIDQALLAVLPTPHAFVRLLGLAGKVVVLDEVHAYDPYVFALIERLCTYMAALGSRVIVLSATLPEAKTRALLEAYLAGAPSAAPTAIPDLARYPRLSVAASSGGVSSVELATSAAAARAFELEMVPDPLTADAVIGRLVSAARDGAQVGYVANTVARAQQIYLAVVAAEPGLEVGLFHARYPLADRLRREEAAIARYGQGCSRVRGSILIATQVIEQSLDLDFDLLGSDLAPVDLLLQRVGRLHRHRANDAGRPACVRDPRLLVALAADDAAGLPDHDRGSCLIYGQHVLDRTVLALRARGSSPTAAAVVISLPEDVGPLVEEVYADAAAPAGSGDALRARWTAGAAELARRRDEADGIAGARRLPGPAGRHSLPEAFRLERGDGEVEIATRLGAGSIPVAVLREANGGYSAGGTPVRLDGGRLPRRTADAVLRAVLPVPAGHGGQRSALAAALLSSPVPDSFAATPGLATTRTVIAGEGGQLSLPDGTAIGKARIDDAIGLTTLPR